jgi:ABC-type polar amino acid transport system ATPase subunit
VVLNGVDLALACGECLAIVSPSGSGKSTLLRCLNLLKPVDAARIVFASEDITHARRWAPEIRRRIGMVLQNFHVFVHLSALDNVAVDEGGRRSASNGIRSGRPPYNGGWGARAYLAQCRGPQGG